SGDLSDYGRNILMDNADKLIGCLVELTVRKIYRVGDLSVLYVVNKLLRSHYRAVVLRLRCGSSEMRDGGNSLYSDKLVVREVGDICGDVSGRKSRDDVGSV